MTTKTLYAIQSSINGRYLSNLFEDDHAKTFQAVSPNGRDAYRYSDKKTAQSAARQLCGIVTEVKDNN